MRYLVSKKVSLRFPDGKCVDLALGIQEYPDEVAAHWAFSHYATPLDGEQTEAKVKGNAKKQQASN